ncbi:hypothetical protein [Saccharothrix syringae]|uniref:Uncharacterized protein n=1 Tax=Saccharothrix syringae TaxID=103733 RepID=A0A5Q0GTT8_SACSY|nr:hypothetical protein [Saccharothrix syringae]QFZ17379.1 hypothetical protein EKG83_07745 [Saccharothrix syringae]
MKLTLVAGNSPCDDRNCPTIYATDRGTIAVQGALVPDTGDVTPPDGEAVVEIPLDLLVAAARAVG